MPRTMRPGNSDFQRVPTRWRWLSRDKRRWRRALHGPGSTRRRWNGTSIISKRTPVRKADCTLAAIDKLHGPGHEAESQAAPATRLEYKIAPCRCSPSNQSQSPEPFRPRAYPGSQVAEQAWVLVVDCGPGSDCASPPSCSGTRRPRRMRAASYFCFSRSVLNAPLQEMTWSKIALTDVS